MAIPPGECKVVKGFMGEWDYFCTPATTPPSPGELRDLFPLQLAVEAYHAKERGRELSEEDVLRITKGAFTSSEARSMAQMMKDWGFPYPVDGCSDDYFYNRDHRRERLDYCNTLDVLGFSSSSSRRGDWQSIYEKFLRLQKHGKRPYQAFKALLELATKKRQPVEFTMPEDQLKFFSSMTVEEREDILPDLRINILANCTKMNVFGFYSMMKAVEALERLGVKCAEDIFSDPVVKAKYQDVYKRYVGMEKLFPRYREAGVSEDMERIYNTYFGESLFPSKTWDQLAGGWTWLVSGVVGMGSSIASTSKGSLASLKAFYHIK